MNALQSYSTDSESEDDQNIIIPKPKSSSDPSTNYDDVGMDISEESGNEEPKVTEATAKSAAATTIPHANKNGNDHAEQIKPTSSAADKTDKATEASRDSGNSEASSKAGNSSSHASDSSTRTSKDNDRRTSSDHSSHNRDRPADKRSNDSHRSNCRDRNRDKERERDGNRDRDRKDRDYRRRKSRSHSRSRSRERERDRRRPYVIRKEAQAKLAALRAAQPDLDPNELVRRGMEAQLAELQKTSGVQLPTYYNPAVMNPAKIADQERKKKLLWGNKKTEVVKPEETSSILWSKTKFSNDSDGKMAEKFKRLMGVKSQTQGAFPNTPSAGFMQAGPSGPSLPPPMPSQRTGSGEELLEKQENMFESMERQYEVARQATHTHKGFGLGFTSHVYTPKP